MHKCRKLQRGFLLLEVLIAFVILAIGIIALAKVQGLFFINGDIAEQKAAATSLAQAKIEQLRDYTSLTGSGNSYANIASGSETVTGRNTTFALTWIVGDNVNPPYKTVDATVVWTAQDGVTRTVVVSSIIGRLDPVSIGRTLQTSEAGAVSL